MKSIFLSLKRCRNWMVSIFITYSLSCLVGILMTHCGNRFSLSYRDKIVGRAMAKDQTSISYSAGKPYKAALTDFAGNLFLGAFPQTVIGLGIVVPYFSVAYQGWVGGIVSVDGNHRSRLRELKSALYYIIVLILQYLPYSMAIGSGIRLGVETYRLNKTRKISEYRIDRESLKDVMRIYVLVIPLFLIASGFEFLSPWNHP